MKEAVFQYKCKMCGKVYDGACCGEKFAFKILIDVLLGIKNLRFLLDGNRPRLIEFHLCDKKTGQHGVGDLIGYKIR